LLSQEDRHSRELDDRLVSDWPVVELALDGRSQPLTRSRSLLHVDVDLVSGEIYVLLHAGAKSAVQSRDDILE
jgi:hypothetical protein